MGKIWIAPPGLYTDKPLVSCRPSNLTAPFALLMVKIGYSCWPSMVADRCVLALIVMLRTMVSACVTV